MSEIPDGMALDEEGLRDILSELMDDRWQRAHELAQWRAEHFFNMASQDPVMPAMFADVTRIQSDLPRQVHEKLRARLIQNHPVAEAHHGGRGNQAKRDAAERLSTVLNQGLESIEERLGSTVIGGLADGAIIKAAGVLHWRRAEDHYGPLPKNEWLDAAPDEKELDKYQPRYVDPANPDGTPISHDVGEDGAPSPRAFQGYRETDDALMDRYRAECAGKGWPYHVEFVDWEDFACLPDRGCENGMGAVAVKQEMGVLRYARRLNSEALSLHEANQKLGIGVELPAPRPWEPSAADWTERVTIYQLWTRDEFYEVVVAGQGTRMGPGINWRCTKAFPHRYSMPPFALMPGTLIQSNDPALRYQPALAGVFRLKPAYDRYATLMLAVAEATALPIYFFERVGTGEPLLGDDGKPVYMNRNSAMAAKVPDGYKLSWTDERGNPAFMEGFGYLKGEYEAARPETGEAQIEGGDKPWKVRLEQEQRNVSPKALLTNGSKAVELMLRSWARDLAMPADDGGFPVPPAVYGKTDDRQLDREKVIFVEPDEITSLQVDVTTTAVSASEQLTLQASGQELLNDPKVPITQETFLRDYMHDPNPSETLKDYYAEQIFQQYIIGGLIKQRVAKVLSTSVVLGVGGELVGPAGNPMTPEQVLQMNGQPVQPQGGPAVQGPPQPMPARMPGMGTAAAPGTMPIEGPRG